MIGCQRKLERFFHPESRRILLLPLDHGASEGLTPGLADLPGLLQLLDGIPVQGVVLNKGRARAHAASLPVRRNVGLQLSGGTKHGLPSYNKSIVCGVPEALRLGADAVAVQVNIGNDLEDRMLQDFGGITDEAHQVGLPVIAVIFARGGQIVNELDPSLIAHCIRLGGEMGADMVCAPYSGDPRSYSAAIASCPAPVLTAGGQEKPDFASFLAFLAQALGCGAAGIAVGRNVFSHPDPAAALRQLAALVHGEGAAGKAG